MTFSIHMANIVFHDKPVESNGEAEKIRNDPTSSPHSRGTLLCVFKLLDPVRIIPAFAGNTFSSCVRVSGTEDHPRIRGEHRLRANPLRTNLGSSPHSRGTPALLRSVRKRARIIPAFAGNTIWRLRWAKFYRDHPRIRGEHSVGVDDVIYYMGSSPHSRGTRTCSSIPQDAMRIIPAFAGNTNITLSVAINPRDHPRIRGEHTTGNGTRKPA